jgi:hypothetical protein
MLEHGNRSFPEWCDWLTAGWCNKPCNQSPLFLRPFVYLVSVHSKKVHEIYGIDTLLLTHIFNGNLPFCKNDPDLYGKPKSHGFMISLWKVDKLRAPVAPPLSIVERQFYTKPDKGYACHTRGHQTRIFPLRKAPCQGIADDHQTDLV